MSKPDYQNADYQKNAEVGYQHSHPPRARRQARPVGKKGPLMAEKLKSAEEWVRREFSTLKNGDYLDWNNGAPHPEQIVEFASAIQRDAIEKALEAYYDAGEDEDPDAKIRALLPDQPTEEDSDA